MDKDIIIDVIHYLGDKIKGTKYEGHVCLVGGCVRDDFMGNPIHDFDVVIDLYNGGISFANFLAIKNNNLILSKNPVVYGTKQCASYKFDLNGQEIHIECSQTRKDPIKVDFTRTPMVRDYNLGDFTSDSKLRDLTINSMYINVSTGELYDPNNGLDDLEDRILRCPNDPDVIFHDDPLRMMRIIRFSSTLQFGIEKATWLGIVKNHELIKDIAVERIADEFNKILLSIAPSVGLKKLMASGLLADIMPCLYEMNHINTRPPMAVINPWEDALCMVDSTQELLDNRLSALFCQVGRTKCYCGHGHEKFGIDIAKEILKHYKYSNVTIDNVCMAIKNHNRFGGIQSDETITNKSIRKLISETGKNLPLVLDVMKCYAYIMSQDKIDLYYKIQDLVRELKNENTNLPINGNDIMKKFNLPKGAIVGKMLNIVKNAMFDNPNMTKEMAFDIIEKEYMIETKANNTK